MHLLDAIRNFKLIGGILIPITQYSIPVIEAVLGLGLIFNLWTLSLTKITVYLLAFFTAMVTVKSNCRC